MPYDLKNSDLADVWLSAPPQDRESVLYDFVESTIRDSTCDKKKLNSLFVFFIVKCCVIGMKANTESNNLKKNIQNG